MQNYKKKLKRKNKIKKLVRANLILALTNDIVYYLFRFSLY